MEEQWKVTAENLESFIEEQKDIAKNRLLILNNPGNPSGMVYTANELKELSEVCRKLNITVLSDEIYGLLNFKGQHECMAKYYPEGTLVTSGFSKWSSAGAQWGKCLDKVDFKFIFNNNGGFHLVDLIITELKDHMTCFKFECSHWWKTYF